MCVRVEDWCVVLSGVLFVIVLVCCNVLSRYIAMCPIACCVGCCVVCCCVVCRGVCVVGVCLFSVFCFKWCGGGLFCFDVRCCVLI